MCLNLQIVSKLWKRSLLSRVSDDCARHSFDGFRFDCLNRCPFAHWLQFFTADNSEQSIDHLFSSCQVMANRVNTYLPSNEVNTNFGGDQREFEDRGRVDLGKQFLTSEADTSDDSLTLDFNPPLVNLGQPFVTSEGFLSLIVNKDIRIDFHTNHSICVTTASMKVAVDHLGLNIGVIHPFGHVFQEYDKQSVHIESGLHLAKMCPRGVTFTSLCRSLIYLVDTSGCKTTTERFRKLNYDFTADIFYNNSLSGDIARQRSFAELCRHAYEESKSGTDKNWWLAGDHSLNSLVLIQCLLLQERKSITIWPTEALW